MVEQREVIVIGGGAMGAATAWHLACRGRGVVLFEQFELGHARGSSHGATRNFNTMYTDPRLQALVQEAHTLWRELEDASGETLLDLVGLVNHGTGIPPRAAESLRGLGVDVEELDPVAAGERWGGIRFDTHVLHIPTAGRVRAEAAVAELHAEAVAAGCETHFDTQVLSVREVGGQVEVATNNATYRAPRVVVTAGPWVNTLLGGVVPLPKLRVTEEQPSHFAPTGEFTWPSFNHFPDPRDRRYADWLGPIYGMLTPGEGIKAGWHLVGPEVNPDERPGRLDWMASSLARYAEEWLPGVDPATGIAVECMYTSTEDSSFVLERYGNIVVGSGFSGEGFKFTPAIGRVLADLAEK